MRRGGERKRAGCRVNKIANKITTSIGFVCKHELAVGTKSTSTTFVLARPVSSVQWDDMSGREFGATPVAPSSIGSIEQPRLKV